MLSDVFVFILLVIAFVWVRNGLDVDQTGTAAFEICQRRIIATRAERAERDVRRLTDQAVLAMLDEVRQLAELQDDLTERNSERSRRVEGDPPGGG